MWAKFVLMTLTVNISGCAYLAQSTDDVAQGVASGVTFFCDNADVNVREQFSKMVNKHAAPNSISVHCENGYELAPAN